MPNKPRQIEIKGDMFIPFKLMDDTPGGRNLGRAEFTVCIRKNEFWVYHKQQRGEFPIYHYKGDDIVQLLISGYEGLDAPRVWSTIWCNEHKATMLSIYPPDGARYLWLSNRLIGFTRANLRDK